MQKYLYFVLSIFALSVSLYVFYLLHIYTTEPNLTKFVKEIAQETHAIFKKKKLSFFLYPDGVAGTQF